MYICKLIMEFFYAGVGPVTETCSKTGKSLSQHKGAVKRCDQKNGIIMHARQTSHQVKWESSSVKGSYPIWPIEELWKLCRSIGHRGVARRKTRGFLRSHHHGHMVYKNSGNMDTMY